MFPFSDFYIKKHCRAEIYITKGGTFVGHLELSIKYEDVNKYRTRNVCCLSNAASPWWKRFDVTLLAGKRGAKAPKQHNTSRIMNTSYPLKYKRLAKTDKAVIWCRRKPTKTREDVGNLPRQEAAHFSQRLCCFVTLLLFIPFQIRNCRPRSVTLSSVFRALFRNKFEICVMLSFPILCDDPLDIPYAKEDLASESRIARNVNHSHSIPAPGAFLPQVELTDLRQPHLKFHLKFP